MLSMPIKCSGRMLVTAIRVMHPQHRALHALDWLGFVPFTQWCLYRVVVIIR